MAPIHRFKYPFMVPFYELGILTADLKVPVFELKNFRGSLQHETHVSEYIKRFDTIPSYCVMSFPTSPFSAGSST